MQMTTPTRVTPKSARHLLSDDEFARVVSLVQRDNDGIESELAGRIVEEALKFVAAAAANSVPGRALRPSATVDMGWHALILHTSLYSDLCRKLYRFIHHTPEGPDTLRRVDATLDVTMGAIREAGYEPVPYLWGALADMQTGADCMHSEYTEGGSSCAAPEPDPPTTA
jgi:hypothetical protein